MSIKELITQLDLPDDDFWYDHACIFARDIIDNNYETIIKELTNEWKTWPLLRQEHLAYTLGEGSSAEELDLIKDMMQSEDKEVAFRAKESYIEFNKTT